MAPARSMRSATAAHRTRTLPSQNLIFANSPQIDSNRRCLEYRVPSRAVTGRARLQPCHKSPQIMRALAPEGRFPRPSQIASRSLAMPIFEYVCKQCHHQFEALLYGKEKAECPKCHATKLEPQLSVFAVSAKARPPRHRQPEPADPAATPAVPAPAPWAT